MFKRFIFISISLGVLLLAVSAGLQWSRLSVGAEETRTGKIEKMPVHTESSQSDPAENGAGESIEQDPVTEWELTLVNADHPLEADFVPPLEEIGDGLLFDERAIGFLRQMLDAAREQGLSPAVCSAYRSQDLQRELYEKKVDALRAQGYSRDSAAACAARIVAYPGTSEHQLGLAADIVSEEYGKLNSGYAGTAGAKWLAAHCFEYGFILRYPKDRTEITGVIYEPWHFRYVGIEAAREIMEKGICLEEYLTSGD